MSLPLSGLLDLLLTAASFVWHVSHTYACLDMLGGHHSCQHTMNHQVCADYSPLFILSFPLLMWVILSCVVGAMEHHGLSCCWHCSGKSKIKPRKKRSKKKTGNSPAECAPATSGMDQSHGTPAEEAVLATPPSADPEGVDQPASSSAHLLPLNGSQDDSQDASQKASQEASQEASQDACSEVGQQTRQEAGPEANEGSPDLQSSSDSPHSNQPASLHSKQTPAEAEAPVTAAPATLSEHVPRAYAAESASRGLQDSDQTQEGTEQPEPHVTAPAGSIDTSQPRPTGQQVTKGRHASGDVPDGEERGLEVEFEEPREYGRHVQHMQGYVSGLGPTWQVCDCTRLLLCEPKHVHIMHRYLQTYQIAQYCSGSGQANRMSADASICTYVSVYKICITIIVSWGKQC